MVMMPYCVSITIHATNGVITFHRVLPTNMTTFLCRVSEVFTLVHVGNAFSIMPLYIRMLYTRSPARSIRNMLYNVNVLGGRLI